jgi:hypothetical protein
MSIPTRQTDQSLMCIWYENLIGIWYPFRSVYGSNSDQKPPYSPIKFFFQHIKLQSNFVFFDISHYFDTKIRNFLKSIWYENFEVNLISVSPIKKAHFFSKKIIFFLSRGCCGHLYTAFPQQLHTLPPYVLFICKTKSRLRRRHCGLARHFKTDPTETVALCFGYAKTLQLTMKALWPGASFQNRSY